MEEDRRLAEAFLRGDNRAFTRLVERYRYAVFGLCLGFVGDFDAAEDAAQEAFVAAYRKLGTLSELERFGPWLKRIAANQCRMWLRRQRFVRPFNEGEAEAMVSLGEGPELALERRQTRQQVEVALERLQPPQRQVLTLFYLEDLSLGRIAAFLNLPVQTVNQRLYRARSSLKREILAMVKKTLEEHKMPDDFSQRVIKQALAEGAKALEAKDWSAAKDQFGKVTELMPDHAAAHRGLGLASGGAVSADLAGDPGFADKEKVQHAFEALHRAHELNPQDESVIRRLVKLYSNYGRHREGGQVAERAADNFDQWPQQVGMLKLAVAVYYHSHYIGGEDNMESCVRCHRRARRLVPADLEPRRQLSIWAPAGMSMAYAHLGLSQEVFDDLKRIRALVEDRWAVQEFFQYSGIMTNQYREVGDWAQVEYWSREFVDWAKAIVAGDPRLDIPPMCLTPEADKTEAGKVGISACRWAICYALADRIAKARHLAGLDTTEIFAELDALLALEEERCKAEGEEAQRHLSAFYQLAANAAYETERYQQAVDYYQREEELAGEIYYRGPLYLAAALTALGRVDEAKQRLGGLFGPVVSRGQIRSYFAKCREFDSIRQDADVVALVEAWRRAEGAGRVVAVG